MTHLRTVVSVLIPLVVVVLVGGCASAKKKQCEGQDWGEYGRSIGAQGTPWESQPYLSECRQEGIEPNTSAIQAGFKVGSASFCDPAAFKSAGLAGDARVASFCAADQQQALMAAYQAGLKGHCTKQGAFNRGKLNRPNLKLCPANVQESYNQNYLQGQSAFYRLEIAKQQKVLYDTDARLQKLEIELAAQKNKQIRYEYLLNKKDRSTTEGIELGLESSHTSDIKRLEEEKLVLLKAKENVPAELARLTHEQSQIEAQIAVPPTGELDKQE